MNVSQNKVISLTYELRLQNEKNELVETVNETNPLEFIYGTGRLLPKFEENLSGLNKGDSFDFSLTSADAYGEINTDAIVEVPVAAFEINGSIDESLLKIGNVIPMQDASGNRMNGVVKEVNGQNVKMDFNHPLAGENLHFKGEVVEVRDATEEEIAYGLNAGGGCCGGGCGCGSSHEEEGSHEHNHEHAHEHAHAGDDACGCGSGCGCG